MCVVYIRILEQVTRNNKHGKSKQGGIPIDWRHSGPSHKNQILEINIAQSGFLVLGSIETNMSPSLRTERPHSPIVISMGNQAKSKIRS